MMVLINRGAIHTMFRAAEVRCITPHTTWSVSVSDGEGNATERLLPACVEVEWLNGASLHLICDSLKDPKLMARFMDDLQAAMVLALAWKTPVDQLGKVGPIVEVTSTPQSAPRSIVRKT